MPVITIHSFSSLTFVFTERKRTSPFNMGNVRYIIISLRTKVCYFTKKKITDLSKSGFYLISTVHILEEWPQTTIHDCARNVELLNHNFCCESSIMSVPAAAAAILDNYGTLVDNWRNYILFMLSSQPTQCCSVTIIIGDYAGKIIFGPSTLILFVAGRSGCRATAWWTTPSSTCWGARGRPAASPPHSATGQYSQYHSCCVSSVFWTHS